MVGRFDDLWSDGWEIRGMRDANRNADIGHHQNKIQWDQIEDRGNKKKWGSRVEWCHSHESVESRRWRRGISLRRKTRLRYASRSARPGDTRLYGHGEQHESSRR